MAGLATARRYVAKNQAEVVSTEEMETMREVRKALSVRGIGGRRSMGAHAHWTPSRRGM